jgi:GT2 family glycosyltransferase
MAMLSVAIGTFNRREQLRACLESVFEQTSYAVTVYVSDAGSTDGTVEYLRSIASERLVPVFEGRRRGQAAALNDVFTMVGTPYVAWLSDDNVVVNRGLDTAVGILEADPAVGMVALKVKDVAGPFVSAPYVGGISTIGVLNVNQGVVRTEVLRQVGGFSEAFRDYGIDPDLTTKVLFSGHAIVYTRQVAVHHHRAWSADRSSPEYEQQMARQRAYQDLYSRKYSAFARGDAGWRLRKALWSKLRGALRLDLASSQPVLGLLVRDWHNIFGSRYVSLFDSLRCRKKPYHLRQYCPPHRRPARLPVDPPAPVISAVR